MRSALAETMPHVSRLAKRRDWTGARRLLLEVVDAETAELALRELGYTGEPRIYREEQTTLSDAQRAVLWAIACGLTGPEIAERYHRALETIYSHRKAAMARLRATSQAGAVAEAYRRGIFSPDDPLIPHEW